MAILDFIKDSFSSAINEFMREIERQFSGMILKRIYHIKKQIMRELVAIFIMIISMGFLAISAVFFLIEYMHLNKTLSFLIIGIIVLIIGILIKLIK